MDQSGGIDVAGLVRVPQILSPSQGSSGVVIVTDGSGNTSEITITISDDQQSSTSASVFNEPVEAIAGPSGQTENTHNVNDIEMAVNDAVAIGN